MKLTIAILSVLVLASSVVAMAPPESYGENQCQLIAKDYQREHGGTLIWIQPIDENGNYIFGKFNAHIINKIYDPVRKSFYYIDYGNRMESRADNPIMSLNGYPAVSFDLGEKRPEFSLIWHY